jgi:hypothetical protein
VALAPAIAALAGLGVAELWRARASEAARWMLAALVGVTGWWTYVLLGRASWHPELRWVVLLVAAGAAGAVLLPRLSARLVAPVLVTALLTAPTAYSVQTAAAAHTGALPTAGPSTSAGFAGGRPGGGPAGGPGGTSPGRASRPTGGFGGSPPGGGNRPGGGNQPTGGGGNQPSGGAGGLAGATTVSSALTEALTAEASSYTWVAATTGDNEAASLELATGESVMAIGGYNGTDDVLTLAQFKALVAAGKIHYYVADPQGFIGSTAANTSTAYAIQQWVEQSYTATTVGGTTVYDLG